ncbi:MAG: M23 family metallopeptidase [Candidatus Sungbacteria bacterium]|uniref:M23 family metallopeptidase n=1 Tax=Candidatus Sungiibacteriota bacterium TaxID=2750080 RepID=A0A932YY07_9BACT|nr:M23 family metallopeptidase [Parcubacteria group bacterium]MBI4132934.1 M23 family metallopeptidase [Candidatus Sungbacteria bacterium]
MDIRHGNTYKHMHQPSRNVLLAKKNAVLLLTLFSSLLLLALKILGAVLWGVKFVVTSVLKIAVRAFGLPLYRGFKSIEAKLGKLHGYGKEQFGENFSRNVVLYGGLVLLSMFVATSNLKARELRPEEVGRNSGMYELLIAQSDYELYIEESTGAEGEPAQNASAHERALSQIGVQSEIEPTGTPADEDGDTLLSGTGDALLKPDLPATDVTPKPRDAIITYVVQDGDTISEVAERFNVSTNTILWENKIGPRDFIKPGQELVILPVTGVTHTVSRGDTLNAIASRYRAKAEDILEVNKLADASELVIGKKITVPDGFPPAPARPVATPSSGLADLGSIFKPAPAAAGTFNWPTTARRITQYFRGWRHTGIDIGNKTGQPIYAADDGVVTTSGWNSGGYGYYVIIDHGNGIQTLYGHNSKNGVSAGDRVGKGDVIAAIGSTGRSTGPHVHFEVRVNGNRVNPLDYL